MAAGKASGMETDPEQAIEHDIEELDQRLDRLEDSVSEARDAAGAEELVGDWNQTDDQAGGEDPVGAP